MNIQCITLINPFPTRMGKEWYTLFSGSHNWQRSHYSPAFCGSPQQYRISLSWPPFIYQSESTGFYGMAHWYHCFLPGWLYRKMDGTRMGKHLPIGNFLLHLFAPYILQIILLKIIAEWKDEKFTRIERCRYPYWEAVRLESSATSCINAQEDKTAIS